MILSKTSYWDIFFSLTLHLHVLKWLHLETFWVIRWSRDTSVFLALWASQKRLCFVNGKFCPALLFSLHCLLELQRSEEGWQEKNEMLRHERKKMSNKKTVKIGKDAHTNLRKGTARSENASNLKCTVASQCCCRERFRENHMQMLCIQTVTCKIPYIINLWWHRDKETHTQQNIRATNTTMMYLASDYLN